MLGGILYSLAAIMANVAYVSYVRNGEQGFRRFAAFYVGFPYTLVSYFVIKPQRRLAESETDARYALQLELEAERDLLLEIRRDRARRAARDQGSDDGAVDEEA